MNISKQIKCLSKRVLFIYVGQQRRRQIKLLCNGYVNLSYLMFIHKCKPFKVKSIIIIYRRRHAADIPGVTAQPPATRLYSLPAPTRYPYS